MISWRSDRLKFCLLILTVLVFSFEGRSQNRIMINIPTSDSEAEYVWQTIQDIKFFEENNYKINLPKGNFIQELKEKAKSGTLILEDFENLKILFKDSIYDKSDYQKGYEKTENELLLINKMVDEISQAEYNWHFKEFTVYQVNLTLYGPGGSYDAEEGSILIYTTAIGQFKNYDNPAYTIIHEITHIGIEESIIANFKVPHALKERIVDSFVFLNFKTYLPDYQIQEMGETRIDPYLKTKSDLQNLNRFVELVMQEK